MNSWWKLLPLELSELTELVEPQEEVKPKEKVVTKKVPEELKKLLPDENGGIDLNELFEAAGVKFCPFDPHGCDRVGTFRCTPECEFHPESYNMTKEVKEKYEKEPWSVYCLTCGEFIDTRAGHPETHVIATGVAEYREKLPKFVMQRLQDKQSEDTEMYS